MQNLKISQPDGFWLVTGAALIWGTIGVATQAIYNIDSTTPLFINLIRIVIATPVLLAICWRVVGWKMFNIPARDLGIMLLSGTFLVLSQAAYFEGIRHIGVTVTTLLTLCLSPLVVVFLSALLKFETLTRRTGFALAFALAGSLLLVGVNPQESVSQNLGPGLFFSLIAAVCYACMLVCGRFLAAGYHPLQVTSIGFCAGALVLVVINLLGEIVIVQTTQGWMLVVYLGLVPTALAYWLFQLGLRSVPATTASIVIMLDPLVAAFLAWVLFGETLTAAGMAGSLLLLLSLFLLSLRRKMT